VVTVAQNANNRIDSVAPLPHFPDVCGFCGFDRVLVTVAKTAAERTANIARIGFENWNWYRCCSGHFLYACLVHIVVCACSASQQHPVAVAMECVQVASFR